MIEATIGVLQRLRGAEFADSIRVEIQNLNVSRAVVDPSRVPDFVAVREPDAGFASKVGGSGVKEGDLGIRAEEREERWRVGDERCGGC